MDKTYIDLLRSYLRYDADTGEFVWLRAPRRGVSVGTVAGSLNKTGYVYISAFGQKHRAHRLAWFWMTGAAPESEIDHKNGLRTDNRFENLRLASRSQNLGNAGLSSRNTSGVKGVSWDGVRQKWKAQIALNGKRIMLGRFDNKESAHLAYTVAAAKHFGEFARVDQ